MAEFKMTKDTIQNVQSILGYIANTALTYRTSLQDRGLLVQQYLEKASDRTEATLKGRYVNQILKDKSKIGTAELAISRIVQETAEAYLAGAFLTGMPIFQAVSTREKESTAEQLNVLTKRDQDMFGWVAELMLAHKDVLKRPICAVEVTWEQKSISTVTTAASGSNSIGAVSSTGYSGNRIKRLDPDNLLFDTQVPPWKVHTDGTFVGYVEKLSYVQCTTEYSKLDPLYIVQIHKDAIWKNNAALVQGNKAPCLYYKRLVHTMRNSIGATESEWGQFWGGNNLNKQNTSNTVDGQFERVTLYVRIPLRDFGYTNADQGIHICKLIYINGYLAYCEPMFNSHGMLPIVLGQLEDGTVHTTAHTEYVLDLQDLGTSFIAATMASMRRAVSDRAIYDPSRINPAEVESANPAQKIKVSVNQYQQDIKAAYHSIPYEDRVSPQFVSMIGFVEQWANKTMGQNPAAQGNFVKGNKTQTEFTTIMNNSDARMQLGAVFLENNFYSAIKQILRMNYLIYAVADTIPNNSTGAEPTTVNPTQLREEAPMYQMASGLMPATKLASTDLLVQGLTFMRSDPFLSIEYDTGAMFISILKQQGLTGLDSYKRTPEQQQQALMQMQAVQGVPADQQSQPQETAQ